LLALSEVAKALDDGLSAETLEEAKAAIVGAKEMVVIK